jgi:hypothetical protein
MVHLSEPPSAAVVGFDRSGRRIVAEVLDGPGPLVATRVSCSRDVDANVYGSSGRGPLNLLDYRLKLVPGAVTSCKVSSDSVRNELLENYLGM